MFCWQSFAALRLRKCSKTYNIRNGKVDISSCRNTTIEEYNTLLTEKSKPIKNDILLTKDGSLGRVALVNDEKMCINQSVALLRVNDFVNPIFLSHLLQSPYYQMKMLGDAGGSTIKHIYITRVDKMDICLPSPTEQLRITKIFEITDDKTDILKEKKTTYEEMKKGLMQQLLTGQIRVKV